MTSLIAPWMVRCEVKASVLYMFDGVTVHDDVTHFPYNKTFEDAAPLTLENMVELIKYSPADGAMFPPSVLAEMTQTAKGMASLKGLSCVVSGGGNLAKEAGDRIAKAEIPYLNLNGSTDDASLRWQGIFHSMPHLREFSTKDLYQPHPTLRNHWLYCGRSDDVIVFSNGEKYNPVTAESLIGQHPEIRTALVVGAGRFQAGLIVEPSHHPGDDDAESSFLDRIWPHVQRINQTTVKHGRIAKHLIMLSDPARPFLYSGKGSLKKGAVARVYEKDIDQLYSSGKFQAKETVLDIESQAALSRSIKEIFESELGLQTLAPSVDFATAGLDSLQIMTAAKILSSQLRASGVAAEVADVNPRALYQNNTLEKFASYLFDRLAGGSRHDETVQDSGPDVLTALLDKYTANMTVSGHSKNQRSRSAQTILVTGTTGSLGSYLLHFLERAKTLGQLSERGLTTKLEKVQFLEADLAKPNFGLSQAVYCDLLGAADSFIHNAWLVNFNLVVESFEPSIAGVRNLADFAAKAQKKLLVVFVSSIASVQGRRATTPIPEGRLADLSDATGGYGQFKLLGSLILDKAGAVSGISSATIRVGQVAGPRGEKGSWNKQEWLPSIIASSITIGALPGSLGTLDIVDWMPIEDVALAILDVCGSTKAPTDHCDYTGYFNLVNPSVTNWATLLSAIQGFYAKEGRTLEVITLDEWIGAVESCSADQALNPAVKLLDTYKRLSESAKSGQRQCIIDTKRMREVSNSISTIEAIKGELIIKWCEQWGFHQQGDN
ncbi:hypothetical protein NLG97_g800 [Lecanicillium saksenae]|uniref:Uncharacterized protein n=1 Tax=Lecanicillium saksenae TaxID=468837 RepID=A0ACC1R6U4_9HYPO|nr:hypothetical protein NLG97_g800 [Lecanicillium saksenae]